LELLLPTSQVRGVGLRGFDLGVEGRESAVLREIYFRLGGVGLHERAVLTSLVLLGFRLRALLFVRGRLGLELIRREGGLDLLDRPALLVKHGGALAHSLGRHLVAVMHDALIVDPLVGRRGGAARRDRSHHRYKPPDRASLSHRVRHLHSLPRSSSSGRPLVRLPPRIVPDTPALPQPPARAPGASPGSRADRRGWRSRSRGCRTPATAPAPRSARRGHAPSGRTQSARPRGWRPGRGSARSTRAWRPRR